MSNQTQERAHKNMSRRQFLGAASALGAFTVVPSGVLAGGGASPSDTLNLAFAGAGGIAWSNLQSCDSQNIVALCDVDSNRAQEAFNEYPEAKKYADYRRMIDEMRDTIDAVVVSTPDHTHAVISSRAMKEGLHVHTEKPLTHTIWEARQLRKIADETGVVAQMGNEGHSEDSVRRCREYVEAGALGPVREIHCWTDRPKGWWPQGEVDTPTRSVPDHLEWDLWLGPAKERDYSPAYLPFKWRGFRDFGTGAFGDMGCHIMDMPFYALQLGHPVRAEASTTKVFPETYPERSIVRYEFPPKDGRPDVTFYWYSGHMKPNLPESVPHGTDLPSNGCMLVGDKGALVSGVYGENARIYPESRMDRFRDTPKTYPRVGMSHLDAWFSAIKEDSRPPSDFDYATRLTETVLVGTVAIKAGRPIEWDGEAMEVTNVPEANRYVRREYRKGWSL